MLPILNIGPLAIQTTGLVLLAGIWLGFWLMEKEYHRFGVQPEAMNNLLMYGLIAMVLGGRIGYVAEHFSAFTKSPINLISLNPVMVDWSGGLLIGLAVSILYGIRRNLQFWQVLDALTPGAAAIMVAVPLMNLTSGNAYGEPAHLPWSIFLWGSWRHPTQIYAALGSLLILIFKVLLPLRKTVKTEVHPPIGVFFLEFAVWSAVVQILAASFRGDGQLIFGVLRTSQVAAWLVLALSLFLIWTRRTTAGGKPEAYPGRNNAAQI